MKSHHNQTRTWGKTIAGGTAALLIALAAYVSSYVAMSINGQYLPGAWGVDGPKRYTWSPYGFDGDGELLGNQRSRWIATFYVPLWWLDRQYWHDDVRHGRRRATTWIGQPS